MGDTAGTTTLSKIPPILVVVRSSTSVCWRTNQHERAAPARHKYGMRRVDGQGAAAAGRAMRHRTRAVDSVSRPDVRCRGLRKGYGWA